MSNYNLLRRVISKTSNNGFFKDIRICNASSREDIIKRQNELFNLEKKRQAAAVGRIEKINIKYVGLPEQVELIMNKDISTPFDCAKHLGGVIPKRSVVALLNGDTLWHMHRPLPESCTLDLLHFAIPQPSAVNKIFWRTCSFLLGATANTAFKDTAALHLHSFPSPNVKSGSFVYDVEIGMDWKATEDELRVLSIEMVKIIQADHPLEYLNVTPDLALEIFKDNPHKSAQIPAIAMQQDQKVPVFRCGEHLDITRGPLLARSGLVGRCTVTAVHPLKEKLYRLQGVALPQQISLNHFAYSLLEDRAKKLNSARLPGQEFTSYEHSAPADNRLST